MAAASRPHDFKLLVTANGQRSDGQFRVAGVARPRAAPSGGRAARPPRAGTATARTGRSSCSRSAEARRARLRWQPPGGPDRGEPAGVHGFDGDAREREPFTTAWSAPVPSSAQAGCRVPRWWNESAWTSAGSASGPPTRTSSAQRTALSPAAAADRPQSASRARARATRRQQRERRQLDPGPRREGQGGAAGAARHGQRDCDRRPPAGCRCVPAATVFTSGGKQSQASTMRASARLQRGGRDERSGQADEQRAARASKPSLTGAHGRGGQVRACSSSRG